MSNSHVYRDNSCDQPSSRAYLTFNLRQTPPHRAQSTNPPLIPVLLHQRVQGLGPPSIRVMCYNLRFRAIDALRGADGSQSPECGILLLFHVSSLPGYRMDPGILLE